MFLNIIIEIKDVVCEDFLVSRKVQGMKTPCRRLLLEEVFSRAVVVVRIV